MSIERIFPGIENFLVLSSSCQIGRFESGGKFSPFVQLSADLKKHATNLLGRYSSEPDSYDIRPALVIPASSSRKWASASIIFDKRLINTIFATGDTNLELTPFQKRNQFRSIYQGMELMVRHESKSAPGVAVFCPILYGKGTRFKDYPDYLVASKEDISPDTPVFEVLNLLAALNPKQRSRDWVRQLVQLVDSIAIEAKDRSGGSLSLRD